MSLGEAIRIVLAELDALEAQTPLNRIKHTPDEYHTAIAVLRDQVKGPFELYVVQTEFLHSEVERLEFGTKAELQQFTEGLRQGDSAAWGKLCTFTTQDEADLYSKRKE